MCQADQHLWVSLRNCLGSYSPRDGRLAGLTYSLHPVNHDKQAIVPMTFKGAKTDLYYPDMIVS